jgi:uncharacterized protein (DUF2062 family)
MKLTTKVGVWLGVALSGAIAGLAIGLFFMLMDFLESWSPKLWGAIVGIITFALISYLIKEHKASK